MTTCGHSLFILVPIDHEDRLLVCDGCGCIATLDELAEAARERRQRNEATS